MSKMDLIDLALSVKPMLKPGIIYEKLTLEQKKQAYKDIYGEDVEIIYEGRGGYHGGGRPRKDVEARRVTISISGTPTEIDELKKSAESAGLSVSRYILDNLTK